MEGKNEKPLTFTFTPDASGGLHCVRCGTPNPDSGPVCGNCDENPFQLEEGETISFNPIRHFKKKTPIES
ncbi:hypothetical protein KJ665_00385 [Patescibacteria group bacterium]|nr:hypothetical protein [Patescibacteria group bacterium]